MTTLRQLATDWSLGIAFAFAVLYLNAYLDYRHPDAEALTAEVVADRAAEFAASNNQAANVAMKEQ